MARVKTKSVNEEVQVLFEERKDLLKELMGKAVEEFMLSEMTEYVGAGMSERSACRSGHRNGYYPRTLVTRIGKLELLVPRDREGRFSTEIFDRYQRSEKAFIAALAQMYVEGVSTRKVKAVTMELCGHEFSPSTVSRMTQRLDEELDKFAGRLLEEEFPYLILDARYEKVRIDGVIRSMAVLIAIGVDWDGRRQVLAVDTAPRESSSHWREMILRLKERGLRGVRFVVSDDHPGLKRSVSEVLSEAVWQRCYVHFLRNALDHFPRKGDPDCLTELRWLYDRRDADEARRDLETWKEKWRAKHPKLCEWVEENIEETFAFYCLPVEHHKHMKSTNMLERQNEEIKRRTRVVRIFPNEASCLRLIRALAVERHEEWIEEHRYLNMELLKERERERRLTMRTKAA